VRGAFPSKPRHGIQLNRGHSLARGLIARFLLNEGAGIGLYDLVSRLNHATLFNADTSTAWRGSSRGLSLAFDGVDDIAFNNVPTVGPMALNGSGQGSMVVWFRTTTAVAGPNQILSASATGGTVSGLTIRIASTTQMQAAVNAGGVSVSSAAATVAYSDGFWHQAVAVYDGATISFYYDGVLRTSAAATGAINANDGVIVLGALTGGARLYTGQIGDARVYNRALHPAEVARLFAEPYADMATWEVWQRRDRDHALFEVEAELKGAGNGWSDLSSDLSLTPTLTIDYGINGSGATDLVAGPGRMTFALRNDAANSAGLLGYYSPQHANCRSGFKLGIGIRFRYTLNGTVYYKFQGWLDSIDPIAGQRGARKVACTALDWIDQAMRQRVTVATQVNKRTDEILTALVAAAAKQPTSTSFDVADSTFPFALDNSQSEDQPLLSELQRLALSEGGGHITVRGDTTGGGRLRFEKRTARIVPISIASFSDTMRDLSSPIERSEVINKVLVTVHPRRVDALATSVLFSNQGAPQIDAGATVLLTGQYNDPSDRHVRVGGKDMVTPVATAISTSSVASPTVITTATPHGLTTGDDVVIYGHAGSTPSINGTVYVVTVTGPNTFTIPVNVTVGGSGGSVVSDYRMNTLADGTGTDVTSSLAVTATYGANSVDYSLVSSSGAAAFITKLQARGRGLRDYDPILVTISDATSIANFGGKQAHA
jgi:hypothetical protein